MRWVDRLQAKLRGSRKTAEDIKHARESLYNGRSYEGRGSEHQAYALTFRPPYPRPPLPPLFSPS